MKNRTVITAVVLMLVMLPLAACATTSAQDDTIAEEVRERLGSNVDLASQQIIVTADNGVVTLRGEISNKNQETEAIAMASSVVGVERVVSLLEVEEFGGDPLEED